MIKTIKNNWLLFILTALIGFFSRVALSYVGLEINPIIHGLGMGALCFLLFTKSGGIKNDDHR